MKPFEMPSVPLAFALLAGLLVFASCSDRSHEFKGKVVDPPKPAAEIIGLNWDGSTFRLSEHRGKVVVLFFGYTFCPDICPGSFAKTRKFYEQLGEARGDVAVAFVTVDPERDKPEKLKAYVPYFDRRFYGVHLEAENLAATKTAYGVVARKKFPENSRNSTFYTVDHTSSFFVIDRAGRLRLESPVDATVGELLSDVHYLLSEPTLTIEEPVARPTPGSAEVGAVYMKIVNSTDRGDRLIHVQTSAAEKTETHETIKDGGIARMVKRPRGFEIPAGSTVALEPGGKHLMLLGLRRPLETDQKISLRLHFENAGPMEVRVPVSELFPGGGKSSCCRKGNA